MIVQALKQWAREDGLNPIAAKALRNAADKVKADQHIMEW
jgi:hypothetical protein